jgi:hypothetical protein
MKRQQWLVVKAEAGKSRAHGWPTMQMAQLVNSADQNRKGQADDTQACKFPEVHRGHSEYRNLIVRDFSWSGPLCFRAEGRVTVMSEK